jgi:hypothetical protein
MTNGQRYTHGGLLHNDVFDEKVFKLQVFGIGIRFGVLQQAQNELDRFLRPATYRIV